MKIAKYLCILLMLTMVLSACDGTGGKATPTPNTDEIVMTITPAPTATAAPTPEATPEADVTPEPQETEAAPQETPEPEQDNPDPYLSIVGFENEKGTVFELTDEEQAIYEKYLESLDTNEFKDVDPISIAKIFIQCGIDGSWEAEYTMIAEKGFDITKLEYQEYHVVDILSADLSSRKEMADIVFANLDEGVFTETEDGFGEILFYQFTGDEAKFRFMKNSDGVWMVKYGPFDEWADDEDEE